MKEHYALPVSSEGELQLPPSRTSESWREGTNTHTHTHTHTLSTHTHVWLLPAQRYRAATHQNCNTAASSWKSHSEAKEIRKKRDIEQTTGIRGCCALLELEYFNPTEQFAYEALHSFFIGLVDQVMIALIGRPLSTYVVAPNHRSRAQRRSTHRGEGCMAFSLSLSLCLCVSVSLSLSRRTASAKKPSGGGTSSCVFSSVAIKRFYELLGNVYRPAGLPDFSGLANPDKSLTGTSPPHRPSVSYLF